MKAEILPPSRLGAAERAVWERMLAATPHLQRGFLTPDFACACETAHGRAHVGLLHDNGTIRAVMPFQFRSRWHAGLRLAERIGGSLTDNAGLIAEPGFRTTPTALMRALRLGGMHIDHIGEAQQAFGLTAAVWQIGHRIELAAGSAAYFAALQADRKGLVQDTERRLRRAARDYGPLRFDWSAHPDRAAAMAVIAAKRDQYRRTGVGDLFGNAESLALLEALVDRRAPGCAIVLTTLTAGDRVLARHFGLMHAGALSYWFPVYDPDAQKVSPGRLLLWHTIQQADANGLRLIDRGEGDAEAKRDFSNATGQFGEAFYSDGGLRGVVARAAQAIEWRLARHRAQGREEPG
jgi:CelD/BcsL family acetyltransferase involved in cellulose biosynthesis